MVYTWWQFFLLFRKIYLTAAWKEANCWFLSIYLYLTYLSIYLYIYLYICKYIYYIYIISIHIIHIYILYIWIIWSSYRKLAWVGFEPTTTEFRSDAPTDCAIRPRVQFALRANFVQLLQFHRLFSVQFHFGHCLRQPPRLF